MISESCNNHVGLRAAEAAVSTVTNTETSPQLIHEIMKKLSANSADNSVMASNMNWPHNPPHHIDAAAITNEGKALYAGTSNANMFEFNTILNNNPFTNRDDQFKKKAAKAADVRQGPVVDLGKVTKKKKTLRWTWKKPKGKPCRPLSAYNLFFANVRKELLERCPMEKIGGFNHLAQHVSNRWKQASIESKATYQQQADIKKQEYKIVLEEWEKSQQETIPLEQQQQQQLIKQQDQLHMGYHQPQYVQPEKRDEPQHVHDKEQQKLLQQQFRSIEYPQKQDMKQSPSHWKEDDDDHNKSKYPVMSSNSIMASIKQTTSTSASDESWEQFSNINKHNINASSSKVSVLQENDNNTNNDKNAMMMMQLQQYYNIASYLSKNQTSLLPSSVLQPSVICQLHNILSKTEQALTRIPAKGHHDVVGIPLLPQNNNTESSTVTETDVVLPIRLHLDSQKILQHTLVSSVKQVPPPSTNGHLPSIRQCSDGFSLRDGVDNVPVREVRNGLSLSEHIPQQKQRNKTKRRKQPKNHNDALKKAIVATQKAFNEDFNNQEHTLTSKRITSDYKDKDYDDFNMQRKKSSPIQDVTDVEMDSTMTLQNEPRIIGRGIAVVTNTDTQLGKAMMWKIASFPFIDIVLAISKPPNAETTNNVTNTHLIEPKSDPNNNSSSLIFSNSRDAQMCHENNDYGGLSTKVVMLYADITTEYGRQKVVQKVDMLCNHPPPEYYQRQLRYLVHCAALSVNNTEDSYTLNKSSNGHRMNEASSSDTTTIDDMNIVMAKHVDAPYFLTTLLYPYLDCTKYKSNIPGRVLHVSSSIDDAMNDRNQHTRHNTKFCRLNKSLNEMAKVAFFDLYYSLEKEYRLVNGGNVLLGSFHAYVASTILFEASSHNDDRQHFNTHNDDMLMVDIIHGVPEDSHHHPLSLVRASKTEKLNFNENSVTAAPNSSLCCHFDMSENAVAANFAEYLLLDTSDEEYSNKGIPHAYGIRKSS